MKKTLRLIPAALLLMLPLACDNSYLESENVEELVVEGWIESGHAPVVLVSTTLPASSTPQPISDISGHVLRYAEVYIEHGGEREYLTARLTDKFKVSNYFTSTTLRGVAGETYSLHIKWQDYEASAVCTIPEPVAIDTVYAEKVPGSDSSFVAKMLFRNDPAAGRYYQTFRRMGGSENTYEAVNFTTLDGSKQDTLITETFMQPMKKLDAKDMYLHPGDTIALKLATTELPIYEFWSSYANYANSAGTVLSVPTNLKGNINGAIGYWAGYGIDIREIVVPKPQD